jgi:4-hydroxy-tetrahydrodipicolinate synthase
MNAKHICNQKQVAILHQINYIKNKPADFMVISGDDPITLQMIADGAEAIDLCVQRYPKDYSDMVRLCLAENLRSTKRLQIHRNIASMFAEGSQAVKAYLSEMGLCGNYLRCRFGRW